MRAYVCVCTRTALRCVVCAHNAPAQRAPLFQPPTLQHPPPTCPPTRPSWHDDFAAFKAGVRDLEVMLENVLAGALATSPGLPARLELLEAYARLAVRPALKRALARAAGAFYAEWVAELNAVKKALEGLRRAPPRDPSVPRYSAAAL